MSAFCCDLHWKWLPYFLRVDLHDGAIEGEQALDAAKRAWRLDKRRLK